MSLIKFGFQKLVRLKIQFIIKTRIYCYIFWKGFDNAKTGKLDKDEFIALMVRRDSNNEPFDPSKHREDYVYEGHKNSLMYLRR